MPIKVKDHDKCKEWERRRRDRLNDAFKNLAQLLPHYDPAKIPAKIDILEKSTEFVKELRLSNSRLLSNQAENDEKCKLIKELQDEVNKLILRVKQLTILLKKADITIPTGPAIRTLGSKRPKWAGKLKRTEDAENARVPKNGTTAPSECLANSLDNKDNEDGPVSESNSSTAADGNCKSVTEPLGPPSITVPLRETNKSKCSAEITKSPTKNSAARSTRSPTQNPGLSAITTTVLPATLISSPQKSLLSEPIFTTTTAPLQLPLQTIILAPCPITSTLTAQPSSIFTRFSFPPSILSKPVEGISVQKIPIKPVLKPIPKVIKRRRKRQKKQETVSVTPAEAKSAQPEKVQSTSAESSLAEVTSQNSTNGDPKESSPPKTVESSDSFVVSEDTNADREGIEDPCVETLDNIVSAIPSPAAEVTIMNEDVAWDATENQSEKSPNLPPSTSKEVVSGLRVLCNVIPVSPAKVGDSIEVTSSATAEEMSSNSIPVLRIIESTADSDVIDDGDILASVVVGNYTNDSDLATTQAAPPTLSIINSVFSKSGIEGSAEEEKTSSGGVPQLPTTESQKPQEIKAADQSDTLDSCQTIGSEEGSNLKLIEKHKSSQNENNSGKFPVGIDETINPSTNAREVYPETSPAQVHTVAISEQATIVQQQTSDVLEIQHFHLDDSISVAVSSSMPTSKSAISEPISRKVSEMSSSTPMASSSSTSITKLVFENSQISAPSGKHVNNHSEVMDTGESSNDKISECIARSIDLIDANDSELMDLGEHWEEAGGSPKSPISPTQMFLNIFPLLPRESSLNEQASVQPPPPPTLQTTPQKSSGSLTFPAATSRSSFFIDAMLPDENSTSNSNNAINMSDRVEMLTSTPTPLAQCLGLTTPQFSSTSVNQQTTGSFSNFYWTPSTSGGCLDSVLEYRPTISTIATSRAGLNSVTTAVAATPTGAALPTSSVITSSSANVVPMSVSVSSNKSSDFSPAKTPKSVENPSKQIFNFESFPMFSKAKTTSSISLSTTTTPAVTTVTWTAAISTANITTPQHQQQQAPATSSITHQFHPSTVSSSIASSSNQLQPPNASHSCSLFDSLSSMDPSFFRPLINTLDSHDFRPLEFSQASSLPPLITPPKPLQFTPQFNPSSPSLQNTVNYHSSLTNHEQHHSLPFQSSIIHQPPSSVSSNNTSATSTILPQPFQIASNTSTVSSNNSSRKQHNAHHQLQHQPHSTPTSSAHSQLSSTISQDTSSAQKKRSQISSTEKSTKLPSAKQTKVANASKNNSRSGKSSRTQPYNVPPPCSQSSERNILRQEQTPAPAYPPTPMYLATSAANQPHSSGERQQAPLPLTDNKGPHSINTSIAYDFHQSHSYEAFNPPNFGAGSTASKNYMGHSSHSESQSQTSRGVPKTPTNDKPHKTKDKSTLNQTKGRHGQTSTSTPQAPSTQIKIPPPIQVPSTSSSVHQSSDFQAIVSHSSSKSYEHSQHYRSGGNNQEGFHFQPMPSSSDTFHLFSDFSSGNPARHFTNHQSQVHPQFYPQQHNDSIPNSTMEHPQSRLSSNLPAVAHRSQPYYLPDMSSCENFSAALPPSAGGSQQSNTIHIRHPLNSCAQQSSTSKSMYTATCTSTNQPPPSSQQQAPHMPLQQRSHHSGMEQDNMNSYNLHHHPPTHLMTHPQTSTQQPARSNHTVQNNPNQNQKLQHQVPPTPKNKPLQAAPPSLAQTSLQVVPSSLAQTPFQNIAQSVSTPHNLQQQQHQQHVPPNSAPSQRNNYPPSNPIQSQGSSRQTASRTVNWMTDTAYRTTGNSTNASTNVKQRQQPSVATNNPFSVSKLVGNTAAAKTQPALGDQQQQPSSSNTKNSNNNNNNVRNKSVPGTNLPSAPPANPNPSSNQSNYCAEALIRKNPSSDWNEFNLANAGYSNFFHHQATTAPNTDPFVYSNLSGQYHHHHHPPPAAASHFGHIETQSQHFHPSHHHPHHHHHHHHHQQQQPTACQPSGRHQPIHGQEHQTVHAPYSQQHPSQQHHPNQSHSSSTTSSVSNFNLSTIFPEINDKRSSNINSGNTVNPSCPNSSTTNVPNTAGNINSCNYHHPGFRNLADNSGNML